MYKFNISIIIIIFFTSCSPKNITKHPLPDEYSKVDSIEIHILGHTSETEFSEKPYNIDNFVSLYNNTEIIIHPYNSESLLLKLEADFATGQAPDIFAVWPGKLITNFIKRDMILDLTPYLEKDPEWYGSFKYKELWEPVSYNGKIYGLPIEGITENLFINHKVFRDEGLVPPETFTDLIIVCKELSSRNIVPLDISSWPDLSFLYQALISSFENDPTDINPYIDALYMLKRLYDSGAFNMESVTRLDTLRSGELLISGNTAMMFNGSWILNKVYRAIGKDLLIRPFPSVNNKDIRSMIFGLGSTTYYISNDPTRSYEETKEIINFAKHLTNTKTVSGTILQEYYLSNIPLIGKQEITDLFPNLLQLTDFFSSPPDHKFDRNLWYDKILYRIPELLDGSLTPEKLWDEVYLNDN